MEAVSRQSRLHPDDFPAYGTLGWRFAKHETVSQTSEEYVRDDLHTNNVEGFFAILKRD
jgi:transposase